MTPLAIEGNEQYQLSSSDTIESNMELADELFKFIFYINRKNIKKVIDISSLDSCPYEVPSFEEIIHLTGHRVMVRRAWDLFKYRDWILKLYKDNNEKYYSFEPQDYKEFKIESASIQRTEYDEFQKSMETTSLWKIFNERLKMVLKKIQFVELEDVFDINDEYIKN
jgi:CO dehydrogenase/acetyl-CoA synthase alpha subunit